jgi:hypothetical protein
MIIPDLYDESLSTKGVHDLIEEVRNSDPLMTADVTWRNYALGIFDEPELGERAEILGADCKYPEENLIGQCLDQIASRVRFRHYTVDNDAVRANLETFSTKNQLGKAVIAVIKRVQTDGNAAMSVGWRPDRFNKGKGRAVIHHEIWWDGDIGMFVAVDDSSDVLWAVSEWYGDDKKKRRTLYLPDRITRFRKEGEGWEIEKELPWTRANGKPLGVPVAHFPNGASPYSPYAPSTVKGVVATQDALNSSLYNRLAVSAFTGSQIYYLTGSTVGEDSMKVVPGTLWQAPNAAARFGVLAPGNMDALIKETDDLRGVIAGAFPVPSYRIGRGQWPSGIALQRADSPMIAQSRLLGEVAKPGLNRLAVMNIKLENTYGSQAFDEEALVDVEWSPPDEVDPGTQIEIDQARVNLYASIEDLTDTMLKKTELLTEDEYTDFIAEREAQKAEELAQASIAPNDTQFGR